MPNSPSIAHLLLGFHCGLDTIEVINDSPFSRCTSLFHSILVLAVEYPTGDQTSGILSWPIALKYKALKILKTLWRSPLSSELVMLELRANDFMVNMFLKEVVVNPGTLWDGRVLEDEEFLFSSSSPGLFNFIRHRASLLQYTALEFRRLAQENASIIKERTLVAVEGYSQSGDGQRIETPNVFDLFDFMELEIRTYNVAPQLLYFKDFDLSVCLESLQDAPDTYNLRKVRELTNLRRNELRKSGHLSTSKDQIAFDKEAQEVIVYVEIENHTKRLGASRLDALESWVRVMLMVVNTGGLGGTKKTSFVIQALQTILPKFEKYSIESLDEALMLANLAKNLLFSLNFDVQSFQKGEISELASDRLFQLFRVCLRAAYSPIASAALKETLYGICYRYLTGMSDILKSSSMLRKHSAYTIKAAGERFMDVICDDAYAGDQTCRISALLLLGALITLATQENSKYIVDALVRLNFIGLVVDSIRTMLVELRECKHECKNLCHVISISY
jgi:nuclear pore complex protein Nup205